MSRRSSPSFAIGGVSWLGPTGKPGNVRMPPEGRWRCFICDEVFPSISAAYRHFGTDPALPPRCCRDLQAAMAALMEIGAYEDAGANAHLVATGSYALFDEPHAVEKARAAIDKIGGPA